MGTIEVQSWKFEKIDFFKMILKLLSRFFAPYWSLLE